MIRELHAVLTREWQSDTIHPNWKKGRPYLRRKRETPELQQLQQYYTAEYMQGAFPSIVHGESQPTTESPKT